MIRESEDLLCRKKLKLREVTKGKAAVGQERRVQPPEPNRLGGLFFCKTIFDDPEATFSPFGSCVIRGLILCLKINGKPFNKERGT
jgi:hypothetical protein